MNFILAHAEDWGAVAKTAAGLLKPGMVIALSGPLGAGKTTFVQALAKELGAKQTPRSPTFSLVRTYSVHHGEIKQLVHVDAYRIEDEADVLPLGLEELLDEPGTILAFEWPEHASRWLSKRSPLLTLVIRAEADGVRRVNLTERK